MRHCIFLAASLVLPAGAIAQASTTSGPNAGETIAPLKVQAVVGDVEGEEVDYVKHRKGKPTVYVFIQAKHWSRPMARFLRKLDAAADATDEAYVVAVWLTNNAEKTKNYLPRADRALDLDATAYTLYPDADISPEGWGINPDASMTAVVTKGGKATASFGYVSVNETDAPKVVAALKKALANGSK